MIVSSVSAQTLKCPSSTPQLKLENSSLNSSLINSNQISTHLPAPFCLLWLLTAYDSKYLIPIVFLAKMQKIKISYCQLKTHIDFSIFLYVVCTNLCCWKPKYFRSEGWDTHLGRRQRNAVVKRFMRCLDQI